MVVDSVLHFCSEGFSKLCLTYFLADTIDVSLQRKDLKKVYIFMVTLKNRLVYVEGLRN